MNEIVAKLREYNRWRRGDEGIAQPDPGEIGRLLDAVCEMVDADIIRSKMSTPTPETDVAWACFKGYMEPLQDVKNLSRKLERERDEARAQVKELIYIAERAIDLAAIDFENDKFGVVSELRDGLEKIKGEQ